MNTSNGTACPTGATSFCLGSPIVVTSEHAQAACEACYGAGQCFDVPTAGIGGSAWAGVTTTSVTGYWYATAIGLSPLCPTYRPRKGDITDNQGCPAGRWAP